MSHRKWILGCLALALAITQPAAAGRYNDLTPGTSTRADADRILGTPLREIVRAERYDYPPDNADTRRISIRFDAESQIILAIDVYPASAYGREDFRGWFHLGDPARTAYDDDGNRVEHYDAKGIALRFSGPDPESSVLFFRHFAADLAPSSEVAKETVLEPQVPPEVGSAPIEPTSVTSIPDDARPYLGLMVRDHPSQGILIAAVVPDCAAERGGLRGGDVILEFDEHSFYGSVESRELLSLLAAAPVSRPVRFLVERGDDRLEIYTTLDLRTQDSIDHQLRLVSRESFQRGTELVGRKKWEQAIPHLERAVLFNYRDVRAQEMLGSAYLRAKRYQQAVTAYRAAAAAAPDSPVYLFWIAVSHDRLGDRQQAIAGYESFLQAGHPDRKLNRDARQRVEYLKTAPQRNAETMDALVEMIEAIGQQLQDDP